MTTSYLKDTTPNPPWSEARLERLERDNYQCWGPALDLPGDCRLWPAPGLHVHHRLPRGRSGRNDQCNLITLCSGHHDWVEKVRREEAKGLGLIIRNGEDPADVPVLSRRGVIYHWV